MFIFPFEKLNLWQLGRKMVKIIYEVTEHFPSYEMYGLVSQMRRSAVSVISNIAEGAGRFSPKDQAHFYNMAYSSLMELLTQVIVAYDMKFIKEEEYLKCTDLMKEVSVKLNALRKSCF